MLAPWKKSYDQHRQHTKQQRHYPADKGLSSQSYGFSSSHVWMWELDYKAECWRIDAFELWCWRRLLRVPWTGRRSNQSILKESVLNIHWKDWYWSCKTLTTWCKELTLKKTLMLGKIEGRRRRGQQRMRWLDGITDSMDMSFEQAPGVDDGQGIWRATVHVVTKSQTRLSN